MIGQALCPVLVGRDDELALLDDLVVAALVGNGGAAVLAGSAGMGKTRLAAELRRRARRYGALVMTGTCPEVDLRLPYLPLIEAVDGALGELDAKELRGAIGPLGGELHGLFPRLFPRSGLDRAPEHEPADQGRLRLFEALIGLLDTLCRSRGALVVVEDLHWADSATREFLDYLLRRLHSRRLAVVVTTRLDELDPEDPVRAVVRSWRRAELIDLIPLAPLSSAEVERMVLTVLDGRRVPPGVERAVAERGTGNPFVVEELLKEILESGDMRAAAAAGSALPRSIAEGIELRLLRLDADERAVLEAAAVLDAPADCELLSALTTLGPAAVEDAVAGCVARQLLEGQAGPAMAALRHSLTREVVLAAMKPSRLRTVHALAAAALRHRQGASAVEVTRHLFAAGLPLEAMPLCLRAADEAAARHAPVEAAELYRRALDHLAGADERRQIQLRLGTVLHAGGDPAGARAALQAGLEATPGRRDEEEVLVARLLLGRCAWELGDFAEARALFTGVLADAEGRAVPRVVAEAHVRLCLMHASVDFDAGAAEAEARTAMEVAGQAGDEVIATWARGYLGVSLAMQGRVTSGLAELDLASRTLRSMDQRWLCHSTTANALSMRCLYWHVRDTEAILGDLRSVHVGPITEAHAACFEASAALLRGRVEAGMGAARRYRDLIERHGYGSFADDADCILGWALLEAGDPEGAALLVADPHGIRKRETAALGWWVHLRLVTSQRPAAAADAVRAAMAALPPEEVPAWVLDVGVSALIAAGHEEAAAALLPSAETVAGRPARRPLLDRAAGRVALARGDAVSAADLLAGAAAGLDWGGAFAEAARARILLARAHGVRGDRSAAAAALALAWEVAEDGSLLATEVLEAARDLGLEMSRAVSTPGRTDDIRPPDSTDEGPDERLVSVLFADVREFTALTRSNPPHELAETLQTFHRWAAREVERRGGAVDKYAGDAVMAVFNARRHQLDHPIGALEAALGIRRRIGLVGLPVGIGIAVGPAVVGRLVRGANLSVVGETTNLAARLQSTARAGDIVLSDEAYRRTRRVLEERHLSADSIELELKGFPGPVRAWRVGPEPG